MTRSADLTDIVTFNSYSIYIIVMKSNQEEFKTSQLQKSQRQIIFMLKERQRLSDEAKANLGNIRTEWKEECSQAVNMHLAEYGNLRDLMQTISNVSQQRSSTGQNSTFWSLNMNIEKDVEDNLRQLKEMDSKLDNTVNQEADTCTLLEQVEEGIRQILINKEVNYLSRAEPLLARKTECLQSLDKLKEVKTRIKQQKLNKIIELLQQLERLKEHREKRLSYCRNKKLTGETIALFKLFLADLNEIMNQRRSIHHSQLNIKKLSKSLDLNSDRIKSLSEELLGLFAEQENIMSELRQTILETEQSKHFQSQLLGKFNLQSTDLLPFMDRCANFIKEEEEKKKELQQILQGVSTTNETIKIFKHIHDAMQSENRRRSELLRRLELIQREQDEQVATEEKMSEIENDLEKLESKRQRLLKKLSSKVNQADLSAYKTVNEELQGVDTQLRAKKIILQDMKTQLSDSIKQLANQAALINEEYSDITSEVMPQLWFKGLDYSKEETATEIKSYLSKLLNRLRI